MTSHPADRLLLLLLQVTSVFEALKEALNSTVAGLEWMDAETRARALEKVSWGTRARGVVKVGWGRGAHRPTPWRG